MGVDTDRDDRRIPGRHGVPQVREEAGSVVTGPSLDLDALREKAEKAKPEDGHWQMHRSDNRWFASVLVGSKHPDVIKFGTVSAERADVLAEYVAAVSPDVILAVLALVEEQRKENEQLREALGKYAKHDALCARVYDYHNDCTCGLDALRDALAGSPAENKEEA